MAHKTQKQQLFILVNNHFDPTWRRCWKRPLEFKGKTFISYNDIETYYLLDNIALAQAHPEYKFAIECPLILRTILNDHPEALPVLQELARAGRFEVSGAGETIVDGNMIHGESLVRNFVDGILWVEAMFGQKTRFLLRNDAFGNSAQLPQIARGLGIECVFGLHYTWPQNTYWRGLDGSTVLHRPIPVAAAGGDVIKYVPCESCSGTGVAAGKSCSACGGRGIPAGLYSRLPGEINQEALKEFGAGIVMMGPEELLPNPALLDWAREMGAAYDVRFAIVDDLLPFTEPFRTDLDNVAEADLDPRVELNPNNAGVWVSRIKTKQIVRRQEQALLALESLLVMSRLQGNDFPAQTLKALRQKMYFTMFHDAITATHVDAAYQELMEIMEEIDGGLQLLQNKVLADLSPADGGYSVINPSGAAFSGTARVQVPWSGGALVQGPAGRRLPVVACVEQDGGSMQVEFLVEQLAPFSALSLQITPAEAPQAEVIVLQEDKKVDGPAFDFFSTKKNDGEEAQQTYSIENSRFQVYADQHGLLRVYDKLLARDILITDEFRPAELILEHDEGSPWATLSPDFTRTSLSSLTQLKRVEKNGVVQQMVFAVGGKFGMGFAGMPLQGEIRVHLVEGLDRVEFDFKTYWATFNHRLRVAMPVPKIDSSAARYWYDIPYGVLQRQPYEPTFTWFGANGDWPAIHWAGVEQDGLSVALFNQGTPSYRMEPGKNHSEVMFLSLLRSPAIPTYLHEPYFYTMTDYDGMRDEGDHAFSFAVSAYDQPFTESSVVLDGEAYQQVLPVAGGNAALPAMPQVQSDNVRLTAVKWAEKDEGMVMRLVEYRGEPGQVEITVPQGFGGVEQVNLLEETLAVLPVVGHKVSLALRPWEITSLKLSMTGKPPAEPSI